MVRRVAEVKLSQRGLTASGNNFASVIFGLLLPATATTAMAPVDADYCRDKARRDLLALLEGVSIVHASPSPR